MSGLDETGKVVVLPACIAQICDFDSHIGSEFVAAPTESERCYPLKVFFGRSKFKSLNPP